MSKKINLVQALVEPIVEKLGYLFVDVDFKKQHGNDTLTIYIDKLGGITHSDCEAVSKAVDQPLDELDFTNGEPYNLNVSSPGLDRPIVKPVDFERNLNKEIEVKFYKTMPDLGKTVVGVLVSYEKDNFKLNIEGKEVVILISNVAKAVPYINF